MSKADKWQFWVDRGGTFTDLVAKNPDGDLTTHKLLSENPEHYPDAVIQGIRDVLNLPSDQTLPTDNIDVVRMGTTVGTNALLQHRGEKTLLVTTKGFADGLRIGYQNRPNIFARDIIKPQVLYHEVVEVDERINANGEILQAIDIENVGLQLQKAYKSGLRSVAIVLMHGYRYSSHEQLLAKLANETGFTQISVSHQVSPLIKWVSRGETTVLDAYLSPVLNKYLHYLQSQLGNARLLCMQSNGGLISAQQFAGKDSVLSGPAGGIVGVVKTAVEAGYEKLISFDMGGTSTDVAHYAGEYERSFESTIAGVRIRLPLLAIHTVAAGGGSVVQYRDKRYQVGPESAGSNPGPACYRRQGPLTVTDCNVMLGRIQPDFFPAVFGKEGNESLDKNIVEEKFAQLANDINQDNDIQQDALDVAQGFLKIAVDNMANAIKKISTQRGYDLEHYTLCGFGGAAGQHVCLVAQELGISSIFIHPYAGVLSAYGMGLADIQVMRQKTIERPLTEQELQLLAKEYELLLKEAKAELIQQGVVENSVQVQASVTLKYSGNDTSMTVPLGTLDEMVNYFETQHKKQYGFNAPERNYTIDSLIVEAFEKTEHPTLSINDNIENVPLIDKKVELYSAGKIHQAPVYQQHELESRQIINGPAMLLDSNSTLIIDCGWQLTVDDNKGLHLKNTQPKASIESEKASTVADPVKLELFNNLFMSIAERMGAVLQNTSRSVNIKERLDFSCAIFNSCGDLIANAPHIPVHLGSMNASIKHLIEKHGNAMQEGDVYMTNDPYHGGTHLPDITVITPVFNATKDTILFYVGSRGHHADIGGISPGSMPADSCHIDEEGALFDNMLIVRDGKLLKEDIISCLAKGAYPARNPEQNLADLNAQIAANTTGASELASITNEMGQDVVCNYMQYIQDNAETAVRNVIKKLDNHSFVYPIDSLDSPDAAIHIKIKVDKEKGQATLDFTGTVARHKGNFNAPASICRAAALYVFRSLIDHNIPLNEGCLKPLKFIIPEGSLLNPNYPAAVVAGNVETSQWITNALYGAIRNMAASQGTMNNFTFGNDEHQYYETIAGGSGAGEGFNGADAVQCHMTNSRLTDPEVLEARFPVLLESFSIRNDSGGKGRYKGGNGCVRRMRFLQEMTVSILSSHRKVPPFGLEGGESGMCGHNMIERANGETEELRSTITVQLNENDVVVIKTPGGGGYGSLG